MANKFNYTVQIDADISNIQSKLENIGKLLEQSSPDITKGLNKELAELNKELTKIQNTANQPIKTTAEFSSLESRATSITTKLDKLKTKLDDIRNGSTNDQLALLPESEVQNLNKATKLYEKLTANAEAYNKVQAQIVAKEKERAQQEKITNKAAKKYEKATNTSKQYDKDLKEMAKPGRQLARKYGVKVSRKSDIQALTEGRDAIKQIYSNFQGDPKETKQMVIDLQTINNLIDKYNQKIQSGKGNQLKKDAANAKQEYESADKALKTLTSDYNKLVNSKDAKIDLTSQFEEAKRQLAQIDGLDLSNIKSIKDLPQLGQQLENLNTQEYEKATTVIQNLSQEMEAAAQSGEHMGQEMEQNREQVNKLDDSMSNIRMLKSRVEYYFSLYNSLRLLGNQFKKAYSTVKELDDAMTETAIVTDYSISDMWDKLPEYTKNANELGVSIKDMYESATLYYQQGLSTNEVMELSVETMKMARIAGLDAEEATNRMTAALRAFNMELTETSAQRINDVYSKVAAISASNVDELSTAMSKVASLAANVGMSFEQTAAYLATGIETTRESADSIGTALKTVLARFAEMKKDPTLVEEVDGETVDVNKVETALKSVGIALRDSNGQIREMGDVFEELNKKWNTLDVNTQRYIATMAAGSRQQSRFIAMMQNYTRTAELYESALNSNGAAQQQFNKTLESLTTKIQNLQNAWNTFLTNLADNETIKAVVDLLTNMITAVNDFIDNFDGIGKTAVELGLLVTAFLALKAAAMSTISGLEAAKSGIRGLGLSAEKSAIQVIGLGTSLTALGAKGTIKSLVGGNGLLAKLATVGKYSQMAKAATDSTTVSLKNASEEVIKLTDSLKKGQGSLSSYLKLIGSGIAKYAVFAAAAIGVAAAIASIVAVCKKFKQATLESQLKEYEEGLSQIQSQISELTNSVIELAGAASTLDEYQDKLNTLARGSAEWNSVLTENNAKVLELAENCKDVKLELKENGSLGIVNLDYATQQQTLRLNATTATQAIMQQNYSALTIQQTEKDSYNRYKKLEGRNSNLSKSEWNVLQEKYLNNTISNQDLLKYGATEYKLLEEIRDEIESEKQVIKNQAKIIANSMITSQLQYENLTSSQASAAVSMGENLINETSLGKAQDYSTNGIITNTGQGIIMGVGGAMGAGAAATGLALTGVGLPIAAIVAIVGATIAAGTGLGYLGSEAIERSEYQHKIDELGMANLSVEGGKFYIDDEEVTEKQFAAAIAEEKLAQDTAEANQKIVEWAGTLTETQASTYAKVINGQTNDLVKDILTSGSDSAETVADFFGVSSLGALQETIGLTGEAMQAFTQQIYEAVAAEALRQKQAKSTALSNALSNGVSTDVANAIVDLDADAIDTLNVAYNTALELGTEAVQSLYQTFDAAAIGTDEYAEFVSWLSSANFTNPITGMQALVEASTDENKEIRKFAATYSEVAATKFSDSSQIAYLLNSSNYEELNKELDKFYKKNHKITGSEVDDLAQNYEDLEQLLENLNLSGSRFANILNSIYKNGLKVENITNRFIELNSKFGSTTDHLSDLHTAIEDLEDEISSYVGADWLEETISNISKSVAGQDYGAEELRTNLARMFGEDTVNAIYNTKNNQAIKEGIDKLYNSVSDYSLKEGMGFWEIYASGNNQIESLKAALNADGSIIFEATAATYEQIKSELQQKFGFTDMMAEIFMQSLTTSNAALKGQLDINSFYNAIVDMTLNSAGDVINTTTTELQTIATKFGRTIDDVRSTLQDYAKTIGKAVKETDWTKLTENNASAMVSTNLGNLSSIQSYLNDAKKTITNGTDTKTFYDLDTVKSILLQSGVTEDLLPVAINEIISRGVSVGKLTERYTYDSNGKITGRSQHLNTGETVELIEQNAANYLADQDYTKNAQEIVSALNDSKILSDIAESLHAVVENTTPIKEYSDSDMAQMNQDAEDYATRIVNSRVTGRDVAVATDIAALKKERDAKLAEVEAEYNDNIDAKMQQYYDQYDELHAGEVDGLYSAHRWWYAKTSYDTAKHNALESVNTAYDTKITAAENRIYDDDDIEKMYEDLEAQYLDPFFDDVGNAVYDTYEEGKNALEEAADSQEEAADELKDAAWQLANPDQLNTNSIAEKYDARVGAWINEISGDAQREREALQKKAEEDANAKDTTVKVTKIDENLNDMHAIANYYDWMVNDLTKINQLEEERARIQAEQELAKHYYILDQERSIELAQEETENIKQSIEAYKKAYQGKQKQINEILTAGKQGYAMNGTNAGGGMNYVETGDLTEFGKIVDGKWIEDTEKVYAKISDKNTGDEWRQMYNEWVDWLNETLDESNDYYESMIDAANDYYEKMTNGESAYSALIGEIATALQDIDEREIETLEKNNEALSQLDQDIVSSMQENINAVRQDIQNQDEEEDLSNLQRRIAYLQQDTTGANKKEILSLQKQLKQDTESYRDTLIDQAITDLENANEKAEEQRQEQIDLLQSQVDYNAKYGIYHKEAERLLINAADGGTSFSVDNTDAIFNVLKQSDSWQGLTASEIGLKEKAIWEDLETVSSWAQANDMPLDELITLVKDTQEYLEHISESSGEVVEEGEEITLEDLQKNWKAAASDTDTGWFKNEDGTWSYRHNNNGKLETLQNGNVDGWNISNGIMTNATPSLGPGTINSQTDKVVSTQTTKKTSKTTTKEDAPQATIAEGKKRNTNTWYYYSNSETGTAQSVKQSVITNSEALETGKYWLTALADEGGGSYYYVDGWVHRGNYYYLFDSDGYLADFMKKADFEKQYNAFETGGLADYTGPAWLDGTKSKPELVLNAQDTANFIALKDILGDLANSGSLNGSTAGTYMFDVDINVDEIGDDYDTQKLAEQVKSEITKAMTYRNVTSVSTLR